MIRLNVLGSALLPRIIFIRTKFQFEMKWYLSFKTIWTDLKQGLAIKPKTDENYSDIESTPVKKASKDLEMAAVNENNATDNRKKPRNLNKKKTSELKTATIPSSKLGINNRL